MKNKDALHIKFIGFMPVDKFLHAIESKQLTWSFEYIGIISEMFKHLFKEDTVNQDGVLVARHLPGQKCEQDAYLCGKKKWCFQSVQTYGTK